MHRVGAATGRGRARGQGGKPRAGAASDARRATVGPAAALGPDGAAPDVDELLGLQREAGNQAVAELIEGTAAAGEGDAGPRTAPADLDVGFNPLDIRNRLVRAIDQSEASGAPHDPRTWRRHVAFDEVLGALSGLTPRQVAIVEQQYEAREGRPLRVDLFGSGASGFPSDLSLEQTLRLKALLGGTRADAPEGEAAARERRLEADAAELHTLLYGRRGSAEVERVMALLRRSTSDNADLVEAYERLFVTRFANDLGRLGIDRVIRASMLMTGSPLAADGFRLHALRAEIETVDAQIRRLSEPSRAGMLGQALGGGMFEQVELARLRDRRTEIVGQIEAVVRLNAEDAQALAEPADRPGAVTGEPAGTGGAGFFDAAVEEAAKAVGGADAAVIRAVAGEDPGARTAAELRRQHEAGKLTPAAITAALRGLRDEAEADARRRQPTGTEVEIALEERALSDRYFEGLRSNWDAAAGKGPSFDDLLGKGNMTERELNRDLARGGRLDDVTELVLALRGSRKDLETVKRVLADKHADELAVLKVRYMAHTGGRSLEADLFGEAPTKAGEVNPVLLGPGGPRHIKAQGKAAGTDRLILEDYLQRTREGGWDEIRYLSARAEREYEYTIANRGATGWWRDKWGNEARSLLDETIREVREVRGRYAALVGAVPSTTYVMRPAMATSPEAGQLLHRMRLARATIRGDRAGYEQATAKLRAMFEQVASFVLQAALTALLTPAAGALFAARGLTLGARLATWVRNTTVGIASQVGANAAVYGNEYGLAMLKRDLLTGFTGALGSAAGEKLAGALLAPVARGMTDGLRARVSMELAKVSGTVGSMQATALAEGRELVGDLSIDAVLEEHLLGKVSEGLTDVMGRPFASRPAGGGGTDEGGPSLRAGERTEGTPAHTGGEESRRRRTTEAPDALVPLAGLALGGGGPARPSGNGEPFRLLPDTAIRRLLATGGTWQEVIGGLRHGRGVGAGLSEPVRQRVLREVVEHRRRLVDDLQQRFPVELLDGGRKGTRGEEGTASSELESDLDFQVTGDNAGAELIRMRTWLDDRHPGWRDQYRIGLLVEGSRLTDYGAALEGLPARERARIETSITREAGLLALARRLRYTPPDGWAPLIEHLPAADRARARELAELGGDARQALHDRLLLESDAVLARLAAATDPRERARLRVEVTRKQMVANSLSDDAYVGPGTVRAIVAGGATPGETERRRREFETVEDQLAFIAKEIDHADGDPVRAMRSYEIFKYINRTCQAMRSAGIADKRIDFLENWSSLVYRADRGATAEGGVAGGRTHADLPGGYQKASVRVTDPGDPIAGWSDASLRANWQMFASFAEQHRPELRQRALGTGGQGSPGAAPADTRAPSGGREAGAGTAATRSTGAGTATGTGTATGSGPGPGRTSPAVGPARDLLADPNRPPSVPSGTVYRPLEAGKLEPIHGPRQSSSSRTHLYRDPASGKVYLFKPSEGAADVERARERGIRAEDYAARSKAAEITAAELGIRTPRVELVEIDGQRGSLTEYENVMSLADLARSSDPGLGQAKLAELRQSPAFRAAMADIQTLDYLINNLDRLQNLGNYLVELSPKGEFVSLTPIDHDLSFTSTRQRARIDKYTTGLPAEFSDATAQRLLDLSRDRDAFIDRIRPLVGDEAIPGVLHRLDELVMHLQRTRRAARAGGRP